MHVAFVSHAWNLSISVVSVAWFDTQHRIAHTLMFVCAVKFVIHLFCKREKKMHHIHPNISINLLLNVIIFAPFGLNFRSINFLMRWQNARRSGKLSRETHEMGKLKKTEYKCTTSVTRIIPFHTMRAVFLDPLQYHLE